MLRAWIARRTAPLEWARRVLNPSRRAQEDGLDPAAAPPPMSLDALLEQPPGAFSELMAKRLPKLSGDQWQALELLVAQGGDDGGTRRRQLAQTLARFDPEFAVLHERLGRAHRFLGVTDFPALEEYPYVLERFHSLASLEAAGETFLSALDGRSVRAIYQAASTYDEAVQRYNHQTGSDLPRLLVRGGLLATHLKKGQVEYDAEDRVTEMSLRGMDKALLKLMLAVELSGTSTMVGMRVVAGMTQDGALSREELHAGDVPLSGAQLASRLRQDLERWEGLLGGVEAKLGVGSAEGEFWTGFLEDDGGTVQWGRSGQTGGAKP